MIIEESFQVFAPRDAVADLLVDVDRVSGCVPGVGDVQPKGDDEYEASLRIQVGPETAAAVTTVGTHGDLTVRGRLGQFGTGVINSVVQVLRRALAVVRGLVRQRRNRGESS